MSPYDKVIEHFPNFTVDYEFENQHIGWGADGIVLNIKNHPDKVAKFSCLRQFGDYYTKFPIYKKNYEDAMFNISGSIFPMVYKWKFIGQYQEKRFNQSEDRFLYYTVMDKLEPLTRDEINLFWTLCDLDFPYNIDYLKRINGSQNIIDFLKEYHNSNYVQEDFSPINIMKKDNCYKIVDFERIRMKRKLPEVSTLKKLVQAFEEQMAIVDELQSAELTKEAYESITVELAKAIGLATQSSIEASLLIKDCTMFNKGVQEEYFGKDMQKNNDAVQKMMDILKGKGGNGAN